MGSETDLNMLQSIFQERIVHVKLVNKSPWATAMRIDTETSEGGAATYFTKISHGPDGKAAIKGEVEGTKAILAVTPNFSTKPLGSLTWGSCPVDDDCHFYVTRFYHFVLNKLPEPASFCANLARLHAESKSPMGQFGFHCTTYNGDLPQDNTWSASWEAFFEQGVKAVVEEREKRAGVSNELNSLLPTLFEKVIPRLLRPLETGGRKIEPALLHGDLWYGNTGVIWGTNEVLIYDPASFFGHNEYELGNWRPERNKFTLKYFEAYHSHIPRSDPVEDYDARISLYAMRFNINAAALFPEKQEFLDLVIDGMRALCERFQDGYTGGYDRADRVGDAGQ